MKAHDGDVEREGIARSSEDAAEGNPKTMEAFDGIDTPGYPKLADLMAQYNQAAIFRRFRSLNLFNLMRLQAELVELESCLRKTFKSKARESPILLQDFVAMSESTDEELDKLLCKIDNTLRSYNKTLLELSQVTVLKRPHKSELHFIQAWLRGQGEGEGQSFLCGSETLTWTSLDINEFLVLDGERSEADAATGRIVDWLITTYNHFIGRRLKRNANTKMGVIHYSGLKTTAKVLVTLLSSMLPALSILALYFEVEILKRIGIMISMTFIFAATLTFGTSAKRIEIFAATAAFAAVEVVFIGSTDGRNGTRPG